MYCNNNMISNKYEDFLLNNTREEFVNVFTEIASQGFDALNPWLNNVVVIDTEATGLSYKDNDLIQIAAARLQEGCIKERFTTFVNPGKTIPPRISDLTGIYDRDIEGAPNPNEACRKLYEFIGSDPVIAHNIDLDKALITRNPGGSQLGKNLWIDSLDVARVALPRLKSHRLTDLVKVFSCTPSTHRADADVSALSEVWPFLLCAISKLPVDFLCFISEAFVHEKWDSRQVFKHFAQDQVKSEHLFGTLDEKDLKREVKKRSDAFDVRTLFTTWSANTNVVPANHESVRDDRAQESFSDVELLVENFFGDEGVLSRAYAHYEQRPAQCAMAKVVEDSFFDESHVVIEAGTGTGKSLAYLIPSILKVSNNGCKVGIATKTNALLDQLVSKDLPRSLQAVGEILPKPITFAALKGFSHYPCTLKIESFLKKGKGLIAFDRSQHCAPQFFSLLSFVMQGQGDDLDALKIDNKKLKKTDFCIQSHECIGKRCPYFKSACSAIQAKKSAQEADIVVTNQSMLLCNFETEGRVFPEIGYWVIDEAHNLEQEARKILSPSVSCETLYKQIKELNEGDGALIPRLTTLDIRNLTGNTLIAQGLGKLEKKAEVIEESLDGFNKNLKALLEFAEQKQSKSYEMVELWVNRGVRETSKYSTLADSAQDLYDSLENFIKAGQEFVALCEDSSSDSKDKQLKSCKAELSSIILSLKLEQEALNEIFFEKEENKVFVASLYKHRNAKRDRIQALVLDLAGSRIVDFYNESTSIVFTSATLSVGGLLDGFTASIGLNAGEKPFASHCIPSDYNFDEQMKVLVVNDLPDFGNAHYEERLAELLRQIHIAQEGSVLSLFTNKKEMERIFQAIEKDLWDKDLPLLCQKGGESIKNLRDQFIKDKRSSLMALKSFWEGFDAPGETLQTVIIPRLPFGRPDDPLAKQREELDKNAWWKYSLPQAVIEMKQAAGRLIRNREDKGVLILTDRRLTDPQKRYGSVFLQSLPSKNIEVVSSDRLLQRLLSLSDASR